MLLLSVHLLPQLDLCPLHFTARLPLTLLSCADILFAGGMVANTLKGDIQNSIKVSRGEGESEGK